MEMALAFNNVPLSLVTHQNALWIRAVELARALGYSSEKSVSNIYKRNQDEFSNEMSVVINLMTAGTPVPTRIFSLRGCHLLAMLARTPVAKSFRRWVLDVLDKLAEQERAQRAAEARELPDASRLSTPDSRKPLRSLVRAWAQIAGVHYGALWPQVKAHFQLSRIDDLPESWIPDALAFVQSKIDQCGKALPSSTPSTDRESVTVPPAAPGFREDLPADMDAGRKDALKKIQRLTWGVHAALDVVRMFCNPKYTAPTGAIPLEIALNLYRSAEANLVAAYNDLEAGYRLGNLYEHR